MDSNALDGWVAGLPGVVILMMDSNALDGRVSGFREPYGLPCPGQTGGRVSPSVTNSDVLNGRVPGCRVL